MIIGGVCLKGGDDMIQGIYAYNSLYNLLNISSRDLKNTSTSPASIATSMLFGTNLNKTYSRLIDYDAYEDQASFSETFKSKLKSLQDDAKELSDPDSEAFATRDAEFESDAVSVTVEDKADIAKYSIDIEQVAAAQLNETEAIDSNTATELVETLNHVEIGINGEITDLEIERTPNQTNEALFTTIAETINAEDLGVSARVITNDSGQISLSVTGNDSGDENDFTIEGNLAEALDLTTVDRQAQDAIVRVDDQVVTSNTNLIQLDSGKVGIKINSETTIPFELHVEVSGKGALSVAQRFGNSFSQAMIYLQGLNSVTADLLQRQFAKAVTDNEASFEELGITLNDNNEIVIDEQQFEMKFEEDEAEATKILTEFRGAVNQVEKKATQVLRTPPSTFRPAPRLPENIKPYNLSYNQNLKPVPINSLFTSGSIIDVFF